MRTNDVVLQTSTKLLSFVIIIFSIYVMLAGHNNPGGGFIGGLMTSAGFVLLGLAYDLETVRKTLPIDYKILIAIGLLTALLTGIGSFAFGVEFLTHTFGHVWLPLLGETEVATALFFDLGVYFVVVGATLSIIFTIGEDQ